MLWAFVPFLTYGFGTPFAFGYAAVKHRSTKMAVTSAGYGVALAGVLMLLQGGMSAALLGGLLLTLLWLGGTAHAFVVRPSVFPRKPPLDRLNQHAIEVARHRRRLRADARALAAADPGLAHELRIGRPDLPRTYDDGGLVDVNHAPPPVLAGLPGLTPELVERLVRVRDEQGGFISVEELALDARLPPEIVQRLAEYALFLP